MSVGLEEMLYIRVGSSLVPLEVVWQPGGPQGSVNANGITDPPFPQRRLWLWRALVSLHREELELGLEPIELDDFSVLSVVAFGGGRRLTDVFILICSTDDRGHLRTLARLSRLFVNDELINELRSAEDAHDVYDMLGQAEEDLVG